jgi:hypothetical protein
MLLAVAHCGHLRSFNGPPVGLRAIGEYSRLVRLATLNDNDICSLDIWMMGSTFDFALFNVSGASFTLLLLSRHHSPAPNESLLGQNRL